ncbi:NAD(P)H-hydrate epimerase [Frigoribacterium sp. 2-23]|uniref:NAD(P)H-hydrate epimerase n=1 Tax=Frigoribacterium sp. 2-23 TaxID=3415006 RepID=UPI003C6FB287
MVAGWSAAQVKAAEKPHLDAGEPLMQRASAALADLVDDELRRADRWPGRVLVLAGSGDNGGDALFAAALLAARGCTVTILATGSRLHEDGLVAAIGGGAVVDDAEVWLDPAVATERLGRVDLVIDGILGTGTSASPALRGRARDLVEVLLPAVGRADGPPVVAVDIPSGIGPDDGSVPDPVVLPARLTVTFGGHKAGLLIAPASELAGEVVLVDIGIGDELAAMPPIVEV